MQVRIEPIGLDRVTAVLMTCDPLAGTLVTVVTV